MVPKVEYSLADGNSLKFRYVDIIENFDMPIIAVVNGKEEWIYPTSEWKTKPTLYIKNDKEWREWLHQNHEIHPQGVYLIFYKLEMEIPTMRWEEAVKIALCYGWIDSTVKSLGDGKRHDVENLVIPEDLQKEFDNNAKAFSNFKNFSRSYRKSYLYWLNHAKREETRQKRISEIISLCENNIKSRN